MTALVSPVFVLGDDDGAIMASGGVSSQLGCFDASSKDVASDGSLLLASLFVSAVLLLLCGKVVFNVPSGDESRRIQDS
jgi:hypothetical protein